VAFVTQPNSLGSHLPEGKGARRTGNQTRHCERTYKSQYIKFARFIPTTGEVQPLTVLCALVVFWWLKYGGGQAFHQHPQQRKAC